ncbi:MAG: hypothetical protein JWQ79_1456 [Mucilaginibacter sp.]|jgi:hypothetical protein|nr:hypothetical protein [Mucilaginibacter sp.]
MKKTATAQTPEKIGEAKLEILEFNVVHVRKVVYEHKACDHSHGRVNKHAIGINHEPGLF